MSPSASASRNMSPSFSVKRGNSPRELRESSCGAVSGIAGERHGLRAQHLPIDLEIRVRHGVRGKGALEGRADRAAVELSDAANGLEGFGLGAHDETGHPRLDDLRH